MKYLPLSLVLAAIPTVAAAATEAPDPDRIVVTGEGLSLPPGTPAYGSVIIDRDRLTNSASGRIESVLGDVAGFQQFRRSDSRSATPSTQGAPLRALARTPTTRPLVLPAPLPMAEP